MAHLLGLDISTTGAKAILIDEGGQVVATHTTPQPISTPHPLWSEQNPADWWDGIAASIRAVLSAAGQPEVAAVGLTGQMHGLVLLDADGKVLRPSILWNDQRTQKQCDEITERVGFARLIALTGNRALTGFTAPKILWVRENEPEVYAKAAHVLLPKDFIRLKLTGDYVMDVSDASGTNLLDVANRRWSSEVLAALDIPASWMPRLAEGPEITGTVSAEAAAITGLKAGTPVVGGGGDQAAGAVGVGAVEPDVISLVVGTSGVVFAPLANYAFEPDGRLHAFCHAVPGMWHFMGVTLGAAGSLQWYRDTLAPNASFDELTAAAAEVPPGSDGLIFLPYLSGERTPHPDPLARGAFVGLTTRHTQAHLTRAVLEGVAFSLKRLLRLDGERRSTRSASSADRGGRCEKRGLAPDHRRRDRSTVGHDQQHRGRGLRRGAAGGGRRERLPRRGIRLQDGDPHRHSDRANRPHRLRKSLPELPRSLSSIKGNIYANLMGTR